VLTDRTSTRDEIRGVLGIEPAVAAGAFAVTSAPGEVALVRLAPTILDFFVAAGLAPKAAAVLVAL
jgi:hypothetical protein